MTPTPTFARPMRKLKRARSWWPRGFGYGKTYRIKALDSLDNGTLLVLETGPGECDYQLVYPDECKKEVIS